MSEALARADDAVPNVSQQGARVVPLKITRTLIGVLAIVLIWQFLSSYVVNPFLLPTPGTVVETMWSMIQSGA